MADLAPFPPRAKPLPENAHATRDLLGYVPQMPLSERTRRWDKARKKMSLAGLDALVFLAHDLFGGNAMANTRYMFQVDSVHHAHALFPLEGAPVVWSGLPQGSWPINAYALVQEWVSDFRLYGGVGVIASELAARGLERGRIGLVGFAHAVSFAPAFLQGHIEELRRLLPNVTFSDATPLIQEMRLIKTEPEIEMLRGAGKIARKVIDSMIENARPGVTEAALYADMIRTQIANGGEPILFNMLASGPVEHPPTELWHLLHGCEQPLSPTLRPLAQGDIVISEWHTKYGGYRCHTEFTVYLGRPPRELRNIWDVSVECLEASKEALVAGRTIREAIEIIRRPCKRAGLDYVEIGFHAMGNASPEFPTVIFEEGYGSNNLNGHGIGDFVLEEGMCFGNNIDLHDSRWKPDVGCMLADFMVVRPNRAECLIGTPTDRFGTA